MRATLSLIRREFAAYFMSPIAYAVLTVFLGVTGFRFYLTVNRLTTTGPRGVEYPMQFLFSIMPPGSEWSSISELLPELLSGLAFWLVFLLIPPLLTMRLFAEERSTGTLEMLMTAPLRDWQVVLSKYVACFAFYIILWLPTLVYLGVLLNFDFGSWPWKARIDPWPVVTAYLGVALAGAMFLAIGLLVSSLVRSQLVAALVSLVLSLSFVVTGLWKGTNYFSVPVHLSEDFGRGLVDTRHPVLYLSVTLFCLFLTVRSLESRRWR